MLKAWNFHKQLSFNPYKNIKFSSFVKTHFTKSPKNCTFTKYKFCKISNIGSSFYESKK